MTIFPSFNTLALSFTDATMLRDGRFIGLDNFRELLSDARFGTALLNSTLYVVVVVPLIVLLPLILATLVAGDRKSTRLNSSHVAISYAVFCLKKKKTYRA